jgi:hypothetical protein
MKIPVAVLSLLPLLALASPARATDDHVSREVEARFGPPQAQGTADCSSPESREQTRCVRWQYDSGTHHAVFYFEPGTWRLLQVFTWDESTREATNTSEQVRSLLDSARNVNDR